MLMIQTWLSPKDPAFPSTLAQLLGDKAPKRIAAIGNLEILDSRSVALICSIKCPGNLILQTYDFAQGLFEAGVPVIGGFHSPMERECLGILLRGTQPVIVCPGRSLQGMRVPQEYHPHLDQGRLLLLSPFLDKQRRATAQTALYRNLFVSTLAEKVFVPYAAPGSKTEMLCRKVLEWGKPLLTFASEENRLLLSLGAKTVTFDDAAQELETRKTVPGCFSRN
jgi:predicted Rossmann fold nucleotide-binding protein DprA/Smf involved in DNA uptake